jgi:predicted nucleotide-binding protein (sugar kinase/HSP70/actin superfamily)
VIETDNLNEEAISAKLKAKQRELELLHGIDPQSREHYHRPTEYPFKRDPQFRTIEEQREATTLLFGGLTVKHERLLEGALRGMGYRCEALPVPDIKAFNLGKEYGNNGFCNPAYFTGGNVIKHLLDLEAGGLSREEIIEKYAFLTAGYCGPCRFGLYEGELRLALRNAGFEGFRVELIKITGGLDQTIAEAVVDMNLDFLLAIINAILMGDVVRQIRYHVKPYELNQGTADRVLEETLDYLHDILRDKKPYELSSGWKRFLSHTSLEKKTAFIARFLHLLRTPYYTEALAQVREQFDGIPIDPFRVCPIVKIVGEFSAATAEGDMNFKMFQFLEEEGAEVLVDPSVGTQLLVPMFRYKQKLVVDRKGLYEPGEKPPSWRLDRRLRHHLRYLKKVGILTLAERLYVRQCNRYLRALSDTLHGFSDLYALAELTEMIYNWRTCSGEGHLEIGKNIYYHTHDLCHMVLSLKPFGCLPSTQSDGAQVAVVEQYKNMIFLSIEPSGEGEVLAHSRVHMALDSAREKAEQEFGTVLASTGKSLDELRAFVAAHPELSRPTYPVPHRPGVVGRAALMALHVADHLDAKATLKADR